MKIFYSWQMDARRKVNKDFIHDALLIAIGKIGEEPDLTDAEREDIELDQDTQGVLGSPEISKVIFEKIAASRVFVADVSLVGRGIAADTEGKRHINSNVAIELGYAYGTRGDEAVLKVMNTHFGSPSELPFDLRSRRQPVAYDLAEDATKEEIAAAKKALAGTLARILREYAKQGEPVQQAAHVETPSVGLRGKYWENAGPLVPEGSERHDPSGLYFHEQSILYFRCIPLLALPELSVREARDFAGGLRPLVSASAGTVARNDWGVISYVRNFGDNAFVSGCQIFNNREIWAVDAKYSNAWTRPEDDDEQPKRFIPSGAVQSAYPRSITSIRKLAATLGYGDTYRIEMGLSNATGVHIAIKSGFFTDFPGPFFRREVYLRKEVTSDYPTGQIMNDFWEKLFSEIGEQVPNDLVWVPEGS